MVNYLEIHVLDEYFFLILMLFVAIFFGCLLFFISFFIYPSDLYFEKISAYECGFEPFEDTRIKFDIKFYLVSLLFLIFDMEIIYLFPWLVVLYKIGIFGFFVMILFLVILFLGFFYEWWAGALDWE